MLCRHNYVHQKLIYLTFHVIPLGIASSTQHSITYFSKIYFIFNVVTKMRTAFYAIWMLKKLNLLLAVRII